MKYILMHKNIPVMDCEFDDYYLQSVGYVYNKNHLPPFERSFQDKPRVSEFARWWDGRAIPRHRYNLRDVMEFLPPSVADSRALQFVNLGLTLSDQYWIKSFDVDVAWENVNYFDNDFGRTLADVLLGEAYTIHSRDDLIGPSSGVGGDQIKAWKIMDGDRVLLKKSTPSYHKQEALNERIASRVCDLCHIDHIPYQIMKCDRDIYSVCKVAITKDEDMHSAYNLVPPSNKGVKAVTAYRQFLTENGLPDTQVDELLLLDYILYNRDRHWSNFGVICDADTCEIKRCIPAFDFSASLWFDEDITEIGCRDGVYKMTGMPISRNLSLMRTVPVRAELLKQIPSVVQHEMSLAYFPEDRRDAIVKAVDTRVRDVL